MGETARKTFAQNMKTYDRNFKQVLEEVIVRMRSGLGLAERRYCTVGICYNGVSWMNQLNILNPVGYPVKRMESVLRTELKLNLLIDREQQVDPLVRILSYRCNHVFTSLYKYCSVNLYIHLKPERVSCK
jgi:hypothetical protein